MPSGTPEKEMRTLKDTGSEGNLYRNTGSTIQQNSKSTTDEEIKITSEVMSGKAEVSRSSNEQTNQNKDTDIKCKICGNNYKTEKMLQKHMNTKHDDKKVCDLCNKRFKSAEELVHHKLSLHTVSTPDCELCGFKCTNEIKIGAHMVSKHNFKICHIWENTFSNAEQHKKHFQKNHEDPEDQELLDQLSHYLEEI